MLNKLITYIFIFSVLLSNSQNVFDDNVRDIKIYFSNLNWNNILHTYVSNNLGERLIADSIIIDGYIDEDVGVMYRNNSTYNSNSIKNPINIKLDYINNGQSINRYNILNLSNGYGDPSFVREVLAYDIAKDYMPSPKSSYANVYINDTLIGLFTLIQSIDDDFTNENFYERKGPLFQVVNTGTSVAGCSLLSGVLEYNSDTNCYLQAYSMQSSNDWQKLNNFLDTLNNTFSNIEEVMNIDRAIWMLAFQNLLASLDGPANSIANNFYLFQDNNKRFSPILYDMSMSFGSYGSLSTPFNIVDLQQLDVFHRSDDMSNKLTSTIFSNDRFKKMYVAHMRTIINEKFANNYYLNHALNLQTIISNYVSLDPNGFYSFNEFINNINSSVAVIPGISELMGDRISFIEGLNEFNLNTPIISNISDDAVLPHSNIFVTAEVDNANYVCLGYRFEFSEDFKKIQMFDDGNNGDGIAGDGVFGVSIDVDARDLQFYIYAENIESGIFSPERAEHEFHQLPVVSGLVINEIMASNSNSVSDQDGEFDDWVELYNRGTSTINLSGFYLSDNKNDLNKWTFPNINIMPGEYLIIWCDTAGTTQNGLHTTYRLSADQEEVYLTDPSGNVIDAVHFVNMPTDIAYARVPNGNGVFRYQDHSQSLNNQIISSNFVNNDVYESYLYPNPANKLITVVGSEESVYIYDITGKLIISSDELENIDISILNPGLYILNTGSIRLKFIKN